MCPGCGSNVLLVKHIEGLERFLANLTGKRPYRCRMCGMRFRMTDRRKTARNAEAPEPEGSARTQ